MDWCIIISFRNILKASFNALTVVGGGEGNATIMEILINSYNKPTNFYHRHQTCYLIKGL